MKMSTLEVGGLVSMTSKTGVELAALAGVRNADFNYVTRNSAPALTTIRA